MLPVPTEASLEIDDALGRSDHTSDSAAVTVTPPKKRYFYQKPTSSNADSNETSKGEISYPCISERYRQSLEGKRP